MALKGTKTYDQPSPMDRSAFRSSWTQPEGGVGAWVVEGQIIDLNLRNWTVDVISKYDQRRYFEIQVASPYLHPNVGEGIYAFPEVGAKCYVCIPSDGPPPFVLAFVMPQETIAQAGTEEAPQGTQSKGGTTAAVTDASFAGGRPRPKPGDIFLMGRDGNFAILHRGGVLQIGSTQLAQRIYIPIRNLITDISQNYHHYNTGGAVTWGVEEAPSEGNPPTYHTQTFRLFSTEDKATVRIKWGTFRDFVGEPAGDAGENSNLNQLGIGTDEPIICELVVSPEQFNADDGAPESNAAKESVLRFFFDKGGNAGVRLEGSLNLRVKKKLRITVDDDLSLTTKKNFSLTVDGVADVVGGKSMSLTAGVIKLNGGSKPIATVGSIVTIALAAPVPVVVMVGGSPTPGTISVGATFTGLVTTGNPTVLA